MRVIPPKDVFTKKGWLSILACFLAATLLWGSHFIFEFKAVIYSGFPLWSIGISYVGCIIGGILSIWVFYKIPHHLMFFSSIIIFGICQILLQFAPKNHWSTLIALGGIGLSGSCLIGVLFTQLSPAFPDPKYNGRVNGLGYTAMNLMIMILSILNFLSTPIPIILLITIFIAAIVWMGYISKNHVDFSPQKPLKMSIFSSQPQTGSKLVMGFFWGFFLTNPFYAAVNLILNGGFNWNLSEFYFIMFVIIALFSIPNGVLLDVFGRKKVMLFGIGVLSLAFFVLIFPIDKNLLGILFPVILGIGTTLFLTSNSLIFLEFTDKRYIRGYMTVYYILSATGMLGGVLLGWALEPLYLNEPIYLTVVMLFLFLIATIITSQIRETLPDKEELEWKDAIQRVVIMYNSGIPIYSQNFTHSTENTASDSENLETQNNQTSGDTADELLSGTLVTVASILDEIARSRKSLKVIKREELSILIEEYQNVFMVVFTTKELSKIRQKMQVFLEEFGDFFEDALKREITDQVFFYPAKKLIQKHFLYYW